MKWRKNARSFVHLQLQIEISLWWEITTRTTFLVFTSNRRNRMTSRRDVSMWTIERFQISTSTHWFSVLSGRRREIDFLSECRLCVCARVRVSDGEEIENHPIVSLARRIDRLQTYGRENIAAIELTCWRTQSICQQELELLIEPKR